MRKFFKPFIKEINDKWIPDRRTNDFRWWAEYIVVKMQDAWEEQLHKVKVRPVQLLEQEIEFDDYKLFPEERKDYIKHRYYPTLRHILIWAKTQREEGYDSDFLSHLMYLLQYCKDPYKSGYIRGYLDKYDIYHNYDMIVEVIDQILIREQWIGKSQYPNKDTAQEISNKFKPQYDESRESRT